MFGGYFRRADRLLAFLAIYLIWGSTYPAIRWAVDSIPPLLMMSLRCGAAGPALEGWGAISSPPPIAWRYWRVGVLRRRLVFFFSASSLCCSGPTPGPRARDRL